MIIKMFEFYIVVLILVIGIMVIRMIRGNTLYDRLNALFVISTDIILLILFTGFVDGRVDMYVDIALSYGVLGFVSTVIIAKFVGGQK